MSEGTGAPVVGSEPPPAAGPGYGLIRGSCGVVRRKDRAQIRLRGRDPARMINGLITNDLGALSSSRAVYGAMLTPKGRIISDLRVVATGGEQNELWLDIPAGAAEPVREHLRKFVPPMFARAEASPTATVGIYGPRASAVLGRLAGVSPRTGLDDSTHLVIEGVSLVALATAEAGGEIGLDLIGPAESIGEVEEILVAAAGEVGGGRASSDDLEVLRIEAGWPRWGREITEETLPGEVYDALGMMPRAVSFTKGCYTGQEVVVRIAHRGHVNRNLRGIVLEEDVRPNHRTPLHAASGKEVGWTTSTAESPRLGSGVALAYVRREIAPGDQVHVGSPTGPPARVSTLPFTTP